MFKFNSENIFIGYIKQLLASFNLPKLRVYTKEQQKYHDDYVLHEAEYKNKLKNITDEIEEWEFALTKTADADEKEEIHNKLLELYKEKSSIPAIPETGVLISSFRNNAATYKNSHPKYISYMRYIPYIRNNSIQIYAPTIKDGKIYYSNNDWKDCHLDFGIAHKNMHNIETTNISNPRGYVYGLKILNYTKTLPIQNSVYDSDTHEYLGDYLRFQRDYNNINLMPLYNCFSNRVCPNLNLSIKITDTYTADFKTSDKNYKIYMVPIKLFKKYTITMDSDSAIEMCCGLYGQYQYADTYNDIPAATYACFNNIQFTYPKLYNRVIELNKFLDPMDSMELLQHEEDLKLFIKVPIENKSSIVVLEGDYTEYSSSIVLHTVDDDYAVTKFVEKFYKERVYEGARKEYDKANKIGLLDYAATINKYFIKPFNLILESESATERQKEIAKTILTDEAFPSIGLTYYSNLLNNTVPQEDKISVPPLVNTVITSTDPRKSYIGISLADLSYAAEALFDKEKGLSTLLRSELTAMRKKTGSDLYPALIRFTNHTVINFEGNYEELLDKLITPLQLLKQNTGVSYPFADRLIEYLVGNVIGPADSIPDNIERAKSVTLKTTNAAVVPLLAEGIWEPSLRLIYYNYINENYDNDSINHDILGYVDKDVEAHYAGPARYYTYINGVKVKLDEPKVDTISSANIYSNSEWED